jgi:hypothetical protein
MSPAICKFRIFYILSAFEYTIKSESLLQYFKLIPMEDEPDNASAHIVNQSSLNISFPMTKSSLVPGFPFASAICITDQSRDSLLKEVVCISSDQ